MLLGEHCADQPHDRGAFGEDADHVGAAADLAIAAFLRVVRPDLLPVRLRRRPQAGSGERFRARVPARGREAG